MRFAEVGVIEVLNLDKCIDLVVGIDIDHILYRTTLRYASTFGYIIYLNPVATSLLGEEENIIVHCGGIDILYEVFIASVAALDSYASTVLCTELCERSALDVAHVRYCDNHRLIGIEVFSIEVL